MFGVITSYANYLHLFSILGGIFRPSLLIPNGKYSSMSHPVLASSCQNLHP
jgi:hypothetical protein